MSGFGSCTVNRFGADVGLVASNAVWTLQPGRWKEWILNLGSVSFSSV